jgi:hypothetical protein
MTGQAEMGNRSGPIQDAHCAECATVGTRSPIPFEKRKCLNEACQMFAFVVLGYSALKQPPIPLNIYRCARHNKFEVRMLRIDQDVAFVTSGDCAGNHENR